MNYFDQSGFDVRCEWGLDGLAHVASAEVVIIVDVLSFTTTVEVAVSRALNWLVRERIVIVAIHSLLRRSLTHLRCSE